MYSANFMAIQLVNPVNFANVVKQAFLSLVSNRIHNLHNGKMTIAFAGWNNPNFIPFINMGRMTTPVH